MKAGRAQVSLIQACGLTLARNRISCQAISKQRNSVTDEIICGDFSLSTD